jgi:hypothetical protein
MRDLLNALKVLDKYGLLPEKRGRGSFTMETVAAELSKEPVSKRKSKHARKKPPVERRPVTEDEIKQAKEWYQLDYKVSEIARDLDRAESVVRRMLGL